MCTQASVFSFLSVRGHWRERRGHGRDLVRLQRRLQQQDVRHQGHPGRVQQRQRVSNGSAPQTCNRGTFFLKAEAQKKPPFFLRIPHSPRDRSCLQYRTGITGRVESFNFQATGDNHLNDQRSVSCGGVPPPLIVLFVALARSVGEGGDDYRHLILTPSRISATACAFVRREV